MNIRRSTRIVIQQSLEDFTRAEPPIAEPEPDKEPAPTRKSAAKVRPASAHKKTPAKPSVHLKPQNATKPTTEPNHGKGPSKYVEIPIVKSELPPQNSDLRAAHREMVEKWYKHADAEVARLEPRTKKARRQRFTETRSIQEDRNARLISDGSDGKPMLAYEGMYGPAPKPCGPVAEWVNENIFRELVHGILQVATEQPPLPLYRLGEICKEKAKEFEARRSFPARSHEGEPELKSKLAPKTEESESGIEGLGIRTAVPEFQTEALRLKTEE